MMRLSGYPRSQDMIREKLLKVPRHKAVCVNRTGVIHVPYICTLYVHT